MKSDIHNTITIQRLNTYELVLSALFAGLIAVCSWISVPAEIPFTMQTFAVFLTIGLLGGRCGTRAVITYLLLGACGMPVFAGFTGGVGRLLGPTGGYIIGFLFSALVMWGMETLIGRSIAFLSVAMMIGLMICYAFGTIWFVTVYNRQVESVSLISALNMCVIPFIVPDSIKIILALGLTQRLSPLTRNI